MIEFILKNFLLKNLRVINNAWKIKKLSKKFQINSLTIYILLQKKGAYGGKLSGAGGGLSNFCCKRKSKRYN